jgi:CheY-like chemotaxis protein
MSARILVVDPDGPVLQATSQCLTREGYVVATACDGREGLRCLRDFAPALVLTEILMPDKDGIECLLEIKHDCPETKVVAMSGGKGALKSAFVLHLAARLGADGVLAKPFTRCQLARAVRGALANEPLAMPPEQGP